MDAHTFRQRYRWLAWSNREGSDEILIRQALLRPQVRCLADAIAAFGLERVHAAWREIESTDESRRVARVVRRTLDLLVEDPHYGERVRYCRHVVGLSSAQGTEGYVVNLDDWLPEARRMLLLTPEYKHQPDRLTDAAITEDFFAAFTFCPICGTQLDWTEPVVRFELPPTAHERLDRLRLWSSVAVLATYPLAEVRARSLENLGRWKERGSWGRAYQEWFEIVTTASDRDLIAFMTGVDEDSIRLRQSMPYPRMIGDERRKRLHTLAENHDVDALAVSVFEDPQAALYWLEQPNEALGGRVPLEMLDEEEDGAARVKAALNAIATGGVV